MKSNLKNSPKNQNIFDVVVIGAGIIGSAICYQLSRYNLKTLLLESKQYAASLTTTGNSAVLHCGFDANPIHSKAKFNVEGRKLWEKWFEFLSFPRIKSPSLVLAFSSEDEKVCQKLLQQGLTNGLLEKEIYYKNTQGVKEFENTSKTNFGLDFQKLKGALICESSWIIDPILASRTLIGAAKQNQVEYRRETKVEKLTSLLQENLIEISTNKGKFLAKKVINAAGANAEKIARSLGDFSIQIKSRRGQYKVIQSQKLNPKKAPIIFGVPGKFGKGVLVAPRTDGLFIVGPTAEEGIDFKDSNLIDSSLQKLLEEQKKVLCPTLESDRIVGYFAGTRPINVKGGDFQIEVSKVDQNLINVAAIQSPGLSAAPAIAEFVCHNLLNLPLEKKADFNPYFETIY